MRDSYDILKNMNNKTQREYLNFNKARVIDLQPQDGSGGSGCSSSDIGSSADEKDKNLSLND